MIGPCARRSSETESARDSRRALDRAIAREGGLVLIEGPAGIGRSTELEATRRAARERGMTVLAARASELEQTYPFGVVRQLFERELLSASADRRAELLADAAVLAAPALGLDGRPPAAVDAPFSILHGLHWLAAGFQPVLLAVDDAQWADRAEPARAAVPHRAARRAGDRDRHDRPLGRDHARCSTSWRSPRRTSCGSGR